MKTRLFVKYEDKEKQLIGEYEGLDNAMEAAAEWDEEHGWPFNIDLLIEDEGEMFIIEMGALTPMED